MPAAHCSACVAGPPWSAHSGNRRSCFRCRYIMRSSIVLARYESAGHPRDGWVFPGTGECGHFNGDGAKEQHKKALANSGVEPFVPYTLRHTALTRLGEAARGDVFVLARIAGHSSITVTQRYVHPQADAIDRVFLASQSSVGTKLGTHKKSLLPDAAPNQQATDGVIV